MKGQLLSTVDLLKAPPPPMLVDDFIIRRGVTGISADAGVGKTFFGMELIRCIVEHLPFLGKFKTRRGSVLFVGQDCSELQYAQQARKIFGDVSQKEWQRTGRGEETEVVNPYAYVKWLIHDGVDLAKPKDCAQIVAIANGLPALEYDPEEPIDAEKAIDWEGNVRWEYIYGSPTGTSLIVFDTLSTMHSAHENVNDEMVGVFNNLRLIAEKTDSAVIVLHHHSHPTEFNQGNRWRGASSQVAQLDSHFELKKNGKDGRIYVNVRKFRGIPPQNFAVDTRYDDKTFTFSWVGKTGSGGVLPDSWLSATRNFIIDAIPVGERFKSGQVVAFMEAHPEGEGLAMGTLRNRVARCLETLVQNGDALISRDGKGIWKRVE